MSHRAFAIAMLAFLAVLTALVAILQGQTNTLGRFPVADPVGMKGDCK